MPQERRVRRTLIIGAAFAVSFLFAVYLGAMGVVLPALGTLFALGTAVQGRLFPASFGGSVSGVLLCGWLSDRFGRKPVLLVCLAITTLGSLLFGLASVFPMVLAAALLVGAGGAAGQTVSGALLSDLFPERRAVLLNGIQIAFGAGAMIGPVAMQRLLEIPNGWRNLYFVLAAVHLVLLLLLAFEYVPTTDRDAAASSNSGKQLLRNPSLLLLCVSAFLYSGAEVALFSWMPTYLQTLPSGARWAGMTVSVFWVAMTIGRVATGLLISRIPLVRLRLALSAGSAVFGTLTLLMPMPPLILVGVALTGLCFSGIFSLLLAEGGERFPQHAGTALSLIVATSGAGAGLEPYAVGLAHDAGLSWPLSLSLVPISAFFVACLAAFDRSRGGARLTAR